MPNGSPTAIVDLAFLSQLQSHPHKAQLRKLLWEQVKKDLELERDDPGGSLIPPLEAILLAMARRPQDLQTALYRVDLPENAEWYGRWSELAQAVLERCAQKVVLREQVAGRL